MKTGTFKEIENGFLVTFNGGSGSARRESREIACGTAKEVGKVIEECLDPKPEKPSK